MNVEGNLGLLPQLSSDLIYGSWEENSWAQKQGIDNHVGAAATELGSL
jgi:hypothetical protein